MSGKLTNKRIAEILSRAEVCDDSVLTDYADIAAAMRELQEFRHTQQCGSSSAGGSNNCRSSENVQVLQGQQVPPLHTIKAATALGSLPKTGESLHTNTPAPNPIDHGYRPGCECLGCKATVRICADLGGWIPVSERLPENNGTYQVWNGKHVGAAPFLFCSFQIADPEQITHWMPMPAAPQGVE